MLVLTLKQAQTALEAGRLDEAAQLLAQPDLRAHRRGQELIDRLVEALVARGRGHLEAARRGDTENPLQVIEAAQADANAARQFAGNGPEILALVTEANAAMAGEIDRRGQRAARLGDAHRALAAGKGSTAEAILRDPEHMTETQMLLVRARRRHNEQTAALARVREQLAQGDPAAAVALLVQAGLAGATDGEAGTVRIEVREHAHAQVEQCLQQGRLDRASALLVAARPVAGDSLRATELERIVEFCSRARTQAGQGAWRDACGTLRRLEAMLGEIPWITEALAAARRAAEAHETIVTGPLGLLDHQDDEKARQAAGNQPPRPVPPAAKPAARQSPETLPTRYLLQVDGVGSFLVLLDQSVTIGPVSGSRRVDVALITDPGSGVVTVDRSDEDYFARGSGLVVNDEPVRDKLLADGDRIGIGRRCRLRFARPNAASTTAVLDLTSGRLAHADVRKVVLMDRELLIGPEATAHVRAPELGPTFSLVATPAGLAVHGGEALPLGRSVQLGELTVVLNTV